MPNVKGFIDIQCENCNDQPCTAAHCRRIVNINHISEIRRGNRDLARIHVDGMWLETEYTVDQLLQKIKDAT